MPRPPEIPACAQFTSPVVAFWMTTSAPKLIKPAPKTWPPGLRPLTDDDLKAYDASNRGVLAAAGDWVKDNWEYVVGSLAFNGLLPA